MFAKAAQIFSASWLANIGRDRLMRSFGLLGLSEFANRVTRIITTIVLARYLSALEFGIAATAITCFEVIRVLANNGLSQFVIRAPDEKLEEACSTAYRLMLIASVLMAVVQLIAGGVLAWWTGRPELFAMIASLIGVYAVLPSSMVQYWLLQREYRMGVVAGINAAQVGTDNLLTAGLAIFGFGAWAIVLPKVLTAPIWLIGNRRAVKWRFNRKVPPASLTATIRFCMPILASEMLAAVRNNADNMLVGTILGLEALGIYYFAYNAGYGLSSVLTKALAAVSFPHLADPKLAVERLVERFDHALFRLVLPIGLIIVLQAALVPFYVPILFGEKWSSEVLIVGVLCLSAATSSCYDLAAQLLRAGGLQGQEFRASAAFTLVLLSSFAVSLPFGLLTGVVVLCAGTMSMQAGFAFWARWRVQNHLAQLRTSPVTDDLPGSKTTDTGGSDH